MSNKQARAQAQKVQLRHILLVMTDGQVVPIDISKVSLIDKATGKPIFKESENGKQ